MFIESDTRAAVFSTVTDGTGLFGAVDLPSDRYRVRLKRASLTATPRRMLPPAPPRASISA